MSEKDWVDNVRIDGVSIVLAGAEPPAFAIRQPMPPTMEDTTATRGLWHTATDIDTCPCCSKRFGTERAARLAADALFPPEEPLHEPASQAG